MKQNQPGEFESVRIGFDLTQTEGREGAQETMGDHRVAAQLRAFFSFVIDSALCSPNRQVAPVQDQVEANKVDPNLPLCTGQRHLILVGVWD
jgi:hypothetical protein